MSPRVSHSGPLPQAAAAGALAGLRVLEMVDNDAALAGKLLADLGAEVVKIENPRRDRGREQGPLAPGQAGQSLRWISGNLGKESLLLDPETPEGRDTLTKLLSGADILLEATPPGYLAGLGLDYQTLSRQNPGLVMVSITPFGQRGPYSGFMGDDLVLWALGGMLYVTGSEDGPPLQISVPQSYLVAGAHAALAALIAHAYSRRSGRGQQVDLSVQACIPWVAQTAPDYWPCFQDIQRRGGTGWSIPSEVEPKGLRRTTTWRCRDGYVCAYLIAGGPAAKMNAALFQWMREEGCPPPPSEGISWDYFSLRRLPQAVIDEIEAQMARFFRKLDKERLFREGQQRGVMVYPVLDLAEVLANEQLEARGYWGRVAVAGQDRAVPARWAHLSLTPLSAARPAPAPGQHAAWLRQGWSARQHAQPARAQAEQPFAGLLVADFSWAVAGPLTTRYLAEHGATVVRVESCEPRSMDIVRSVPPYYQDQPSLESAGLYHRLNVNKLSLGLDLGTPAGQDLARRLALRADLVVENFRRGVMRKWGLDYAALAKENPGLIYLSSTNLGQTGPLSSYGGFGNLLTAYAGFYTLTGWPAGEPLPLPGAYTDYITPVLSGLALLAALRHRERSGHGQHIDISQLECGLQMLGLPLLQQACGGPAWPRLGNRSPYACPHGVFPCQGQDRWCAISVASDEQWRACQEALGRPGALAGERFASQAGRVQHQDELERTLAAVTASLAAEELMRALQERGVPAGLVASSADLFQDPQLNSRGFYRKLCHPLLGEPWIMQSPAVFTRTPQSLTRHAPCLGQDNQTVCQEILGLPPAEVEAAARLGAFGQGSGPAQAPRLSAGKGVG